MSEFRKEVKDMQVVRNITGIERTVKVISLLQNFIVKYDLKAY